MDENQPIGQSNYYVLYFYQQRLVFISELHIRLGMSYNLTVLQDVYAKMILIFTVNLKSVY